jgi:hypothetical protein
MTTPSAGIGVVEQAQDFLVADAAADRLRARERKGVPQLPCGSEHRGVVHLGGGAQAALHRPWLRGSMRSAY